MMNKSMIGAPIEDLDTPALLLDGAAADRNIEKMAEFFRGSACQLRPHFKNHKCTNLAKRQLAAGSAVGMTCAKLGEAEILADHGFDDVLIANQIVGTRKIERLVKVAGKTRLGVAIDHLEPAKAISRAAVDAGVTVRFLIEVDVGMKRCGVADGQPTLELARQVVDLPGTDLVGLQAFEGHLVYVEDSDQRHERTHEALQLATDSRKLLEENGIPISTISGGSSSTYRTAGQLAGFTEVQAGTYVTMDASYRGLTGDFEIALSVLSSVISCPRENDVVLDVGIKGLGSEFGPPIVKDNPEMEILFFGSEEHVCFRGPSGWRVADKAQLIPTHACTTCNLYREIYVHEEGRVIDCWPIEAAGMMT